MTESAPASALPPEEVNENDLTDDQLLDTEGPAVEVHGLVSKFGDNVVHDGLDITCLRGEVLGVVGGSGAGKSVLLNTIIGLKRPEAGTVRIFGADIQHARHRVWTAIERRWGVLFQQGALWSNLTVKENVAAPHGEVQVLVDHVVAVGRIEVAHLDRRRGLVQYVVVRLRRRHMLSFM